MERPGSDESRSAADTDCRGEWRYSCGAKPRNLRHGGICMSASSPNQRVIMTRSESENWRSVTPGEPALVLPVPDCSALHRILHIPR
jgi:hypothetical protein